MHLLADYVWDAADGSCCGVFVFERAGLLAGLEVWSVDGLVTAPSLPAVERLRPFKALQGDEAHDLPHPPP
jgi:hypothetical protein